jgi:glycosyltransferase involved in cell wall biosynthesis
MMKVLIAANVPKRREGGTAGVAYGVGRGLEQLGHSVEYLFAGDLPAITYLPRRLDDLGFAINLARFLRRDPGRFSVVNIHAPSGFVYGQLRKLLPGMRKNCPAYVMTLHGLEERRVYGMGREAKKGKAFHFDFRNRLWHRLYHVPRFYLSIKTADHAICYGRDTWTMLQLKYDLDPGQVSYVPNGVEERFFIPRVYPHAPSGRLLFAGTWLDQRGIFYLRDALRTLSSRLPGLRLTIAGCGSDAEQVRNFFDPALRPLVDVISMVPSGEMPALFAQNDIFVFPSIMEGTPLAMQEAMASGMAVVTTETCGMIDLVENEFNGLLVPPANSAALENAIWRLSQDPALRARLGRAARETMRRFTWARTVRGVEAACASALRRSGREAEISCVQNTLHSEARVEAEFKTVE